ncbi:hypothetical protein EDD11_001509 [Mortierella claussenii]|nr:hypothetical protein EDD11_001509 [Mortierella claussenii]
MDDSLIPIGSWDTHALIDPVAIDGFTSRPFTANEGSQVRDQRMVLAFEALAAERILHTRRIDLADVKSHHPFSRLMIYAEDNTGGNSHIHKGHMSGLDKVQVKQALTMVLLNMNIDPWIFQHELEPTSSDYSPTLIFQDDRAKRLINVYLDMPSPRAQDDPFMRPDVRKPSQSVQRLLDKTLWKDAPDGMRTKLYNYQKNSLWKLLRRELCPDYILDPSFIPMQDMNRQTYYIYIGAAAGIPVISRIPHERWDDISGGIICEDMDGPASLGICDMLLPPGSDIPSLQQLAAAAVKMGRIEYRRVQDYISTASKELLEDMSVYYYADQLTTASDSGGRAGGGSRASKALRTGPLSGTKKSPVVYLSTSTLVIVPPNLADQWCNEVNKLSMTADRMMMMMMMMGQPASDYLFYKQHTKDLALKLLRIDSDTVKDIPDHRTLTKYDMVLISQTRFAKEYEPGAYSSKHDKGSSLERQECHCNAQYVTCRCPSSRSVSPLMQVRWKRVIVDEGHSMGVKLSDHTLLADKLHADRRWICTGTPTFNLVNLKPSSSSSSSLSSTSTSPIHAQPAISDKGDLDRLLTLMRSFLHLRPYHDNKSLFSKSLVKPLEDHHILSTNSTLTLSSLGGWSLESLSSVARLRYLMDRIMVRNKSSDVDQDVCLPPLYERNMGLDLEYYQVLAINCQVALIQANAVLTEREDQDYFFHPSNRKHLARVIENLKDGCFWYPGGNKYQKQLVETLENVQRGMQKHVESGEVKYPGEDYRLMKDICEHLQTALTDQGWNTIQQTQEVGYKCMDVPAVVQESYALIPSRSTMKASSARRILTTGSNDVSRIADLWPDGTESGRTCIMLAKQIKKLRLDVQEAEQDRDVTNNNRAHVDGTNASLSTAIHDPIVIDLDSPADGASSHTVILPDQEESEAAWVRQTDELRQAMASTHLSQSLILSSTSSKLNYVISQVLRFQHSEKCIVFCQSQTAMYYIHEYLSLAKVRCLMYHTHGMNEKERSNNIMTFNTSENVSAIIMDTQHAAFGIDLSSASRVFFVSPVWQTATMRQAVKRAHRIGQTRPVYVETLVINGSFEEVILNRRKEIDTQKDMPTASSSTSTESSASSSTAAAAVGELQGRKIAKKRARDAKGLLDDSKMMNFISHIGFMPLPKTPDTRAKGGGGGEQEGLIHSLANYWRSARPTYATIEDRLAFEQDDFRHCQGPTKKLEIPVVFPLKETVLTMEQQKWAMEGQDISIVDQVNFDDNHVQEVESGWNVSSGITVEEEDGRNITTEPEQERLQQQQEQPLPSSDFFEELYRKAEEAHQAAEREAREAKKRVQLLREHRKVLQRQSAERHLSSFSYSPSLTSANTLSSSSAPESLSATTSASSLTLPAHLSTLKLETEQENDGKKLRIKAEGLVQHSTEWKIEPDTVVPQHRFSTDIEREDIKMALDPPPKLEPEHYILFDHDDQEDKKGIKSEIGDDDLDWDSRNTLYFYPKKSSDPEGFMQLVDDDGDNARDLVRRVASRMMPNSTELEVIAIDDDEDGFSMHGAHGVRLKKSESIDRDRFGLISNAKEEEDIKRIAGLKIEDGLILSALKRPSGPIKRDIQGAQDYGSCHRASGSNPKRVRFD